jgi:beta-lactamase regulating signal transducer with metallopeptidase domain
VNDTVPATLSTINPAATVTSPHINTKESTYQITDAQPSAINFHSILSLIWLVIFGGLIGLTLFQLLRFRRVLQQATNATTEQYAQLNKHKNNLGISKNIPLLYSLKITSPFTLGLFKPTIILPMNIEQQVTEKQLSFVLLHELTHIQRRDIWWNWLVYGITLMHWFNPLIWFASRRIKADMEMACDAQVLAYLSPQERNDYGLTLIDLSQLTSKPLNITHGLGILENHRELKARLIMMKGSTTMTLKKSLAFGLLFSAFAFAALAQPGAKPNEENIITASNSNNRMTLAEFAKRVEKDLKVSVLVGSSLADAKIPVSVNEKPLDYGQMLSQLKINELTAYKTNGYIQIIAARDARWLAIPTVEKGKKYFADEYVTDSIKLEKNCAGSVLATLRPMVPQFGHLTAMESANTLIISDFYSNTLRIKAMVKMLEDNTPEKIDCSAKNMATKQAPPPKKN